MFFFEEGQNDVFGRCGASNAIFVIEAHTCFWFNDRTIKRNLNVYTKTLAFHKVV